MNKKCQRFTPQNYAEKLLDCVGYTHGLYGKRILENSCGDGNILTVIVRRYIEDCKERGLSRTKIKNGLSKDIWGVEIDSQQIKKCVNKLNDILLKNNIKEVKWQIINSDYLKMENLPSFDYIVGNPPYITYTDLPPNERYYLKENFKSCQKGKFDYCYAFLEKSVGLLSPKGKMSYLIPSSVYKTVFGKSIREILYPFVTEIIDYTQEKLFKDALIKSSIIVLKNNNNEKTIHYIDETTKIDAHVKKDRLGTKWTFKDMYAGKRRFGNYFRVSHVVATLCNRAFLIEEWDTDEKGNYLIGDNIVEAGAVRETTSPRWCRIQKTGKIIFPYSYTDEHTLLRYSEDKFRELYPGAHKYLCQNKDILDTRKRDANSSWYEYGRSQALNNLDCDKLLISTIISSKVPVYHLDRECIPYAGMFITSKGEELSLDDGMKILTKKDFFVYAKNIGIPINGESVRITSRDIENYLF